MSEVAPHAPTPVPSTDTPGKTRLRAVTRRVPRRSASGTNPGEDDDGFPSGETAPEPNMQLSRALGVMLLLHVVAFGGFLAFGLVKERPAAGGASGSRSSKNVRTGGSHAETSPSPTTAPDNAPPPFSNTVVVGVPAGAAAPSPALSRVEADAVRLIESGGPNALLPGERAYVVNRGETIQNIAQKLHVEPAVLLRLNNIDDPRRIQPGQRLRVPPAPGRSRS